MVDASTKQILMRWQSLADGSGLRRAALISRILSVFGLLLTGIAIYGSTLRLNASFTVAAALIAGWVVAEGNALRSRVAQWPIFTTYLDWGRVRQDLNDGT
jgi:hypothetical protein